MANVVTGVVSTEEYVTEEKKIDMDPEVQMLDRDESQFTTYTQDASTKTTHREKVNWLESEYFPRLVALSAVYAATGVVTPVLQAGQGSFVRKGDFIRNMRTGEGFWVTGKASADTLSTVRNIGSAAMAAGAVGDQMLIASNAAAQGADFGDVAMLQKTVGYNYTQIYRHGLTFARTAASIDLFGGRQPAQESAEKGVEHKRALEYSGFWGARAMITDPTTGEPVGFAGGLVEFVTTFKRDVAGSLTADYLDLFFKDALQHGSRNKIFYVAPLLAMQISKFNRLGMGNYWSASDDSVHGVKVDAYISGAYGYRVPVVVKRDWNDFSTASKQYGGWGFLVDHDYVSWRPLVDASTKLLTARQPRGADRLSEEWLTEGTWEIAQERNHGILYGVI